MEGKKNLCAMIPAELHARIMAEKEEMKLSTMPDIPGLAVWHDGHIGVYIGGGQVVEAMGTKYGVVKTELAGRGWTHWLKIPYINYD